MDTIAIILIGLFASATTAALTTDPIDTPRCPGNYHQLGDECFWFSDTDKEGWHNWNDARTNCNNHSGGDLANPRDSRALADDMIQSGYSENWIYWVGGSFKDGRWQWTNGTEITHGWYPGTPSNTTGYDCVFFSPRFAPNGLNNGDCTFAGPHICKVDN